MRIDRWLVEHGYAASRTLAAKAIEAGRVSLNGRVVSKPSRPVEAEDHVDVSEPETPEYVSRAGHKLAGALRAFPDVRADGLRCLDAGASTGGFTQVLLESGAAQVTAVDVGHGQLDSRIRGDARVTAIEGLNVRDLTCEVIGGPVDLVVGDLSFISLRLVVEPLSRVTRAGGSLILMVKPQFEVGRSRLGKGGVVRDDADREAAIEGVRVASRAAGLEIVGEQPSGLPGQNGNREHFLHLRKPATDASGGEREKLGSAEPR
ncbi:TlyA family RNA methyltransferase [Kocuria massiliensis]|uniref:TlyA family RNA methyltransferase n=1 Tax=Kocuria massiliensis TaxID=1926282 RepID=UPI0022B98BA7|nr:TlyA family RNA methyltransferase [Kocuria massiliensis]